MNSGAIPLPLGGPAWFASAAAANTTDKPAIRVSPATSDVSRAFGDRVRARIARVVSRMEHPPRWDGVAPAPGRQGPDGGATRLVSVTHAPHPRRGAGAGGHTA